MSDVLLYARLSVSRDESVSVARQVEAGRQYAAARGWTVAGVYTDDGVSASRTRPEERAGWRALLAEVARTRPHAVVVWKVDRLARSVLDFLNADSALRGHGSGVVAVSDPVDMTSPQGRAFATVLAVFAELEAASIAARVKDARRALIGQGRRAGGRPPYGYCNVPNPDGPGYVLGQVPAEIQPVREGVDLALSGQSLHAVVRHFDARAPRRPRQGVKHETKWADESVETILRNPALAGLVPYSPGRKPGSAPDPWAVLRDADGLPVVDESLAILTLTERQRLLDVLDARLRPGSRPQQRRSQGRPTSLLSRLVVCGSCGGNLARATAGGYRVLRCQNRSCPAPATVTEAPLAAYVTEAVLAERGETRIHEYAEYLLGDGAELARIEEALRAASQALARTDDPEEDARLLAQIVTLKARRAEARTVSLPATTRRIMAPTRGQLSWGQEFVAAQKADDLAEIAKLLREQVDHVTVAPTKGARLALSERVSLAFTPEDGLTFD